jgi:hypothetical protein
MKKLGFLFVAGVAAVSAFVSACGGGDDGGMTNVIDTDSDSHIREQRFAVIKSAPDWSALWIEHKGGTQVPTPTIDFSQNMAVGVFLGQRPSGCYSVAIRGVVQSVNKITIQYKESIPTPTMGCTTALVFPSQIVTIPASGLPVEFAAVD